MNLAVHWPFLITALVVGGWVVWDIARPVGAGTSPPKHQEDGRGDQPMPRHGLDEGGQGFIPVAEIIEREAECGDPLRLNWTDDDTDPHGFALHRDKGDWPTAVLPVIRDDYT